MMNEYLFRVTKEQHIRVSANNLTDAYELAEENSVLDTSNDEVINVELIDVYEDDADLRHDDYLMEKYDDEDDYYEEEFLDEGYY